MVLLQPRFVFFQVMGVTLGDNVKDRAIGGKRDVLFKSRDAE